MDILNKTPFQFAPCPGRINFPGHSLTLIIKGTFDLSPDKKAAPSDEQLYPTGDEFFPDDQDMTSAPRYESDFAYFKPGTDLLLAGHCHCPGGNPVPACPITFGAGPVSRTLYVFGDRFWKTMAGIRSITDPEPFTKMELRYENSFGGVGFKKNPIGKGAGAEKSDKGTSWALPNIEDPGDLIDSPGKRPEPAGFGPMGRMWEQRYSKMGTYSGSYLKDRWPWFAKDFDYAYFNAAPSGMRMDGYLRGDEPVFFENLHPEQPRYESGLPGIRVRCFVNRLSGTDGNGADFREVSMKIDTLWADMDAEKLVLVWRGVMETASEDYEEEVEHIFIMSESLDQESIPLMRCHDLFLTALAEEERQWEMEPEEPPEEEQEATAESLEKTGPEIRGDELKKQIETQTAALLAKVGIDLNSLPPAEREKAKQEQERVIERITETDPDKMAAVEEEEFQAQMSAALEKAGIDVNNLPALSDKAKAEQLRLFKDLGVDDPAILQDPEIAGFLGIMGALMPKMGIDPEDLTPVINEVKKLLGLPEKAVENKEESPVLTREIIALRAEQHESFAGENLSSLDLKGLDLKEIDFTGADLSGADLSGAVLDRAILAGADLTGASLEKAVLIETDATGAKLTEARLSKANLSDAIFEKAQMQNALLEQVSAKDACFVEADLTGAKLSGSDLSGADLSGAILNGADFKGATLAGASVEGATCMRADFTGAVLAELRASEGGNFSKCSFVKAAGSESMWQDAILDGADFSFSKMAGADFTKASLKQANMAAADMKQARFMKADLSQARLVVMNLFEASFEKANLTGADLSGSNMYGVEFLDAIIDKTVMERANLKMTKLA